MLPLLVINPIIQLLMIWVVIGVGPIHAIHRVAEPPPPAPATAPPQIWIFLSHRIPTPSLIRYLQDSQIWGVQPVFRGFSAGTGPLQATDWSPWLAILPYGPLAIDPALFSRFQITEVPAVVLYDPHTHAHDILTGHITLEQAFRLIAAHGSCAAQSRQMLAHHRLAKAP